jgi:hypothetical protein
MYSRETTIAPVTAAKTGFVTLEQGRGAGMTLKRAPNMYSSSTEGQVTHSFTDYDAAFAFYRKNGGIMKTIAPGKKWEVLVF